MTPVEAAEETGSFAYTMKSTRATPLDQHKTSSKDYRIVSVVQGQSKIARTVVRLRRETSVALLGSTRYHSDFDCRGYIKKL